MRTDAGDVKAAFDIMDADRDGRIDMDDWSCFFRRHGQWQEGWMDKAVMQLLHDLYSVGLSTAHLFRSASAEAGAEPIRAAVLHAPLECGGGGGGGGGDSGGGGGGDSGGQILDESWSRSTENASYLCECDTNGERAPVPRSHRPPYSCANAMRTSARPTARTAHSARSCAIVRGRYAILAAVI